MRTGLVSTLGSCLFVLCLCVPGFGQNPIDACDLFQSPESYARRSIEVKGIVYSGFEEFTIVGKECEKFSFLKIWLAYPDEGAVKDDPELKSLNLKFLRNKQSKKFDRLLNHNRCIDGRVGAVTVRGVLQYKRETLVKYPDGSTAIVGFGHMGMYSHRLVLQSVETVEALPCRDTKGE